MGFKRVLVKETFNQMDEEGGDNSEDIYLIDGKQVAQEEYLSALAQKCVRTKVDKSHSSGPVYNSGFSMENKTTTTQYLPFGRRKAS